MGVDLDAIKARREHAIWHPADVWESAADVPALVAEVDELRAGREGLAAAIRALAEHAGRTGAALGVAYDPAYLRWSHLIDSLAEPHRSLLRSILEAGQ